MVSQLFTLLSHKQAEADGSNEYNNFQPGSLNTTKQIIQDLKDIDIVFHIGDICYANGYISQWDQFTAQIEPIASKVPYMTARFVMSWMHWFFVCLQVLFVLLFSALYNVLLVAIMNATGQELDHFMETWIQVVNVVYWLRPCFMFLLRTAKNSGTICL